MADYIYLLENRLSADQQNALRQMREAAREAGMILFLTGDAVRDLTSGHAVRDLEVAVHGNALKLKKIIEKMGGKVWGEDESSKSLYLCFPGTVRVDVISTHRAEYPTPGKPVYHPDSIHEDLRRRDFTVNAMAISLNEGSFGLLMDPMNGAADIEARTLRMVSNYGFLEEPSLLIRATRYMARLGWELDQKTRTRYENAKAEGVIEYLSAEARSQELEQIGHEEEGLKVLQALEAEGWMKVLFPAWTSAKADEEKLSALHALGVDLALQGVLPDMSAAQMQLLTAKLAPKDLSALKKSMLRPGFVEEWNSLDSLASGFAKVLLAKENATPSSSYKIFTTYDPEAILWLGFTTRDAAVKERFELFLKVWPEARQRIPHAILQEMRITPELATYREIVHAVFLELIDGRLNTPEEIRAFLEPHSPPAPPPQVTIKRPRAKRGAEAKIKESTYDDEEESDGDEDEDLDDIAADDEEIDLHIAIPKIELDAEIAEEADSVGDDLDGDEGETEDEEDESEPAPPVAKPASKTSASPKPGKEPKSAKVAPPAAPPPAPAKAAKPKTAVVPKAAAKPEAKPVSAPVKKAVSAQQPSKAAKPPVTPVAARKPAVKAPAKPSAKSALKPPAKPASSKAAAVKPKTKPVPAGSRNGKPAPPAKHVGPAGKKPAAKVAKKR
ncbi:MAG: CCA tRNA nucleotidyltransferase [Terracidiphilus sp.]|jgi:tRNA nucleotidyltransferase/poly(A) polymerase